MKAKDIQNLIDFIANSGLDEVNIETEEFKLSVKKQSEPKLVSAPPAPQPISIPQAVAAPPVEVAAPQPKQEAKGGSSEGAEENKNYAEIKSPMIGTFYRSSSPDTAAFVQIGDKVEAGQTVCIVEAMKLFNEIESDISGTIVKVLVDNSSPVEYDQPLFLVDPA
ncbi:MAG: acetyl-CoA carboxylase biotin carboxyl carrier protein [Bacteroidota bacterium]